MMEKLFSERKSLIPPNNADLHETLIFVFSIHYGNACFNFCEGNVLLLVRLLSHLKSCQQKHCPFFMEIKHNILSK